MSAGKWVIGNCQSKINWLNAGSGSDSGGRGNDSGPSGPLYPAIGGGVIEQYRIIRPRGALHTSVSQRCVSHNLECDLGVHVKLFTVVILISFHCYFQSVSCLWYFGVVLFNLMNNEYNSRTSTNLKSIILSLLYSKIILKMVHFRLNLNDIK